MNISIEITGAKELIAEMQRLQDATGDFRKLDAWKLVANEFYKIEKTQFSSEGSDGASGAWKALTPKYEAYKTKVYGNLPINQRTKALYQSLTSKTDDSVYDEKAQELTLGSTIKYAGYVQGARPVIDLTEESKAQITKPIQNKLRQFIDNSKLRSLRGF